MSIFWMNTLDFLNKENIKSVELRFENVEYAEIPMEYIKSIYIKGILPVIEIEDDTRVHYEAKHISIEFENGIKNLECNTWNGKKNIEDRIVEYNDICIIEFKLKNGDFIEISPYWFGTDEVNYCQKYCINIHELTICEQSYCGGRF